MASTFTVTLPKTDRERLTRLALRYGLSLQEFSRKILLEVGTNIAGESFVDYRNPKALKTSFARALRDYQRGRVRSRL